MADRICVFGSLNVDHTFLVDRLPEPGATLVASEYSMAIGGKGFNQAVTAARQGASVVMVGCVGDDEEGDWLIETLRAEGVDTSFVVRHATLSTGKAHITVARDGGNTIVVGSGANAVATFPSAALEGASFLLLQLECSLDVVTAALFSARIARVTTILNASPALPLSTDLLSLIDYLVVNETEAKVVAVDPKGDYQGTLIVTLGSGGAEVVKGDRHRLMPAIPIERVVDPTAAGDAFCGTLAAGLVSRRSFGAVLGRAAAAGAHAVTVAGAFPSLPRAADVEALLSRPRKL